jgi:hypothetical protein
MKWQRFGRKLMAKLTNNRWEFSGGEVQKQIDEARKRDRIESRKEAEAISVKADRRGEFIQLLFKDGFAITFPSSYIKELQAANPREITGVKLSPDGEAIYWPDLDAHYTISGLLAGRFGNEAWMSEIGKIGGRASTRAKAIAARINGSRGGRPRKNLEERKGPLHNAKEIGGKHLFPDKTVTLHAFKSTKDAGTKKSSTLQRRSSPNRAAAKKK